MKKLLILAAIAALFSMVSCQPEHHYIKGYSYEIKYNIAVSYSVTNEYNEVYAELCAAAKYKPGEAPSNDASPSDDARKAACKAVQDKYANKDMDSPYMLFDLYKNTSDPSPDGKDTKELIGTYYFGNALKQKYVFIKYTSNYDEAFEGFKKAIDRETQHDLYVECGQSYITIQKAFSDWLDKPEKDSPAITKFPWKDTKEGTDWLIEGCNIIYDNNKDLKHPTDLTYTLTKTDFFDDKETSVIWEKTFEAKMDDPE